MNKHRIMQLLIDVGTLCLLVVLGWAVDNQIELQSLVPGDWIVPGWAVAALFAVVVNARRELQDWRRRRGLQG